MKENGSKIAIVSFSSHVSTLRALDSSIPTGAKKLPNRNSLESKPLAAIVGPGACSIFVLAWIYYSALLLTFGAEFTRVCAERRRGLRCLRARGSLFSSTTGASGGEG